MTSSDSYDEAYVWIWLPGRTVPVVAGLLTKADSGLLFNYGRSYLARPEAIALFDAELPLQPGQIPPRPGLAMPNCIRDASPDAWGRRVIINRKTGRKSRDAANVELDELTYLLESGSDRIGALDFQLSSAEYAPRQGQTASLDDLLHAAEQIERGAALSRELDLALQHGTSLGGARPKVLIDGEHAKHIAKFPASGDLYDVVKAEFIAMRLGAEVGLRVAPVQLARALGKDVLLIERFDRERAGADWTRKAMVSALTLLELDEMMARYASYETLAEIIRHRFSAPAATLRELFGRLVFNILCGNTDDHARNHAAFWDGAHLTLTPAYDICPQSRTGRVASQAMLIRGGDRASRLGVCIAAATGFLLTAEEAKAIIARQVAIVRECWTRICDEAALADADRRLLWGRQFLNPFAFEDLPAEMGFPT
jgi:serine/threonine-protein kinase HipA